MRLILKSNGVLDTCYNMYDLENSAVSEKTMTQQEKYVISPI